MSKIPFTRPEHIRFREPSSSERYNQTQEDLLNDLTELFEFANQLEKDVDHTMETMTRSNRFQQMRIQNLEHELTRLESEIASLKGTDQLLYSLAFAEDMQKDNTVGVEEQAYIDPYHGVTHLPITGKMISKTYLYDEVAEQITVPHTLSVTVTPETGYHVDRLIEETDPIHVVDGSTTAYWSRQVKMSLETMPKNDITCQMVIELPDTIISNRDVNLIQLHPFPLNSMDIQKIEYQHDSEWSLLPGWPVDAQGNAIEYSQASNLKLCFPKTPMKRVRITMAQRHWVEENHQKVYHFGFYEIGIFHADYKSAQGSVLIPMTLSNETTSNQLIDIQPTFLNETILTKDQTPLTKYFDYQVYQLDEQGKYQYINDTFPIITTSPNIVVKMTLYGDPTKKITPTLQSVKVSYQKM